jgi:hypothetical protein
MTGCRAAGPSILAVVTGQGTVPADQFAPFSQRLSTLPAHDSEFVAILRITKPP